MLNSKFTFLLTVLSCLAIVACGGNEQPNLLPELPGGAQAVALSGEYLYAAEPGEETLQKLEEAKAVYEANPDDVEAHIWYGRRTAYAGDYRGAINIYTRAIEKFPDDPRLYRHRGHRYISIRMFDEAVDDLSYAATLIEGTEDTVEPDGMPNARGIPVSSLHTNIWYHLGLAYFLKHDMALALDGYNNCLEASANADMRVASSHWLYMILRRLGRDDEAAQILEPIHADMDIIENGAYYRLLLFYKGELPESGLMNESGDGPSDAATAYGLGNWYYYNGNEEKAKEIFGGILETDGWASFGYIAAEADMQMLR